MARNIRKFTTEAEYSAAALIYPSVSLVTDTRTVHFDKTAPAPPVFEGKYKLTLNDSTTVSAECDGTSAITSAETSAYTSTLVSAEIGNCVTTIGERAFQNFSSLTSVAIPNSVSTIGDGAFKYCYSLSSVTIPTSVTSISTGAFHVCSGLTSVTIPTSVTSIGVSAFAWCSNLSSIDIPDSVTTIDSNAFRYCGGLTSCTIGTGVTSIDRNAFESCASLTSITINATTPPTLDRYVFDGSTCPIYVPAASVEAYKAAEGWNTYASRIQAIPTPSYQWVSYETGDTVPTATTVYGVKLYANYDEGYNVIFSGTTGDYIKFHPNGSFGQWSAEDENGTPIDISSYYQAGSMMYTIEFSDLGLGGMNIISPTTIFEDDIDLYT